MTAERSSSNTHEQKVNTKINDEVLLRAVWYDFRVETSAAAWNSAKWKKPPVVISHSRSFAFRNRHHRTDAAEKRHKSNDRLHLSQEGETSIWQQVSSWTDKSQSFFFETFEGPGITLSDLWKFRQTKRKSKNSSNSSSSSSSSISRSSSSIYNRAKVQCPFCV